MIRAIPFLLFGLFLFGCLVYLAWLGLKDFLRRR